MAWTPFPPCTVPKGSRIAQLLLIPQNASSLSPHPPPQQRQGGFGSTGDPQILWVQSISQKRPLCQCTLIHGTQQVILNGIIDTGADVTVISQAKWPPQWPLAAVPQVLAGIRGWIRRLRAFATLGIPAQIKTDNGPAYISAALKTFFISWGITHITGIPHCPTGQSLIERSHQSLKRLLQQQKGGVGTATPEERLQKALYVFNFLNCSLIDNNPPIVRHFNTNTSFEASVKAPVLIRDPETGHGRGPKKRGA
ncbi:uncharacterized protein LOC128903339 [Rissa tridactyla]|uniref:uncharacterized protein LOC128903339 n=1 Tax=Rissa tridactyla TaxID=75485 RepID=UPI0023BB1151|nr:uncharacterized protein LOC128903339 [Rissa tridactyla]